MKIRCSVCHKEFDVSMTKDQESRLKQYQAGEGKIQDLLYDLEAKWREMFLSGNCPGCWKKLIGEICED